MAAPTIDLYTGAIPDRANDSATEFSDNADDMVTYIAEIPDQYNELAEFVNSAASSAQAAANFEGSWPDLSGAYPAGISVEHNGMTWLLLVALSDITASEPTSSNSNWQALASFAQQDQNTNDIAEVNENLQVENRFKGNQNWNVEGSTGSELPDAVARTYTDGEEIAAGRFADGNVVNATLVDYVFNADSGTYYIEYDGDFTDNFYGVRLADGSITQTGCTLSLVGGNTRLSVNMAIAPAHEFPVLSEYEGNVARISDEDSKYFSFSSKLVDVESIRFSGVTYKNEKPYPIRVMTTYTSSSPSNNVVATIKINDETVAFERLGEVVGVSNASSSTYITVNSGETYSVSTGSGATITGWKEGY